MPIKVNKLTNGPIILARHHEPMDWLMEILEMFEQIFTLRDTFQRCPKYYVIVDVSAVKASFGKMTLTLSEAMKTSHRHRSDMPVNLSLIGSSQQIVFASRALGQQQYREYYMPLYDSVDKALNSIHADIALWAE